MRLMNTGILKRATPKEGMILPKDEDLAALKRVLLMMLQDIDQASREAGIDYTAGAGTCLGAIRHQGFIPWDDDLDLNMTRTSFNRFRAKLEELYPEKYTIQAPIRTPRYTNDWIKVRLNGTVERTLGDSTIPRDRDDECGVFVDIFFLENTPNNPIVRALHGFVSLLIGFCFACKRHADNADGFLMLTNDDPEGQKIISFKIKIGKLMSFCSAEKWLKAYDWWNSLCRNDNSKYVTIPAGRAHYFGELLPRSDFFPSKRCPFEDTEISIPANPEKDMECLYGVDYMQIPPKEKRERHVLAAFDLGNALEDMEGCADNDQKRGAS